MNETDHSPTTEGVARFPTTRWSLIMRVAAGQNAPESDAATRRQAEEALNSLCRAYWFPLYAFARRRGETQEAARDLTQDFFVRLIAGGLVQRADPNIAKFRTYLLTHFEYLISNQHRREQAEKRGGGILPVSIDDPEAEGRFQAGFASCEDPVYAFELAWAAGVVDHALARLQADYEAKHTDVPFEALRGHLPGGGAWDRLAYEEIHRRFPVVEEGALRVRVNRLRARFGELMRAVVADTVADPLLVEEELRALAGILARK